MPQDPSTLVPVVLAALLLLVLVFTLASLRAARAAVRDLRAELDGLRRAGDAARTLGERQATLVTERDREVAQLRAQIDTGASALVSAQSAHRKAESDGARLTEAVTRLERDMEAALTRMTGLEDRHRTLQGVHGTLQSDHARLQADTDGKLRAASDQVTLLKEMREKMRVEFEQLAAATLRTTGADFSKTHTDSLTALLTPFREHVGRFETELRNVHKSADEERTRLSAEIRSLTQRSEAISLEATNLTRALKGDKQRQGAWGEMILERILEESGLQKGTHYLVQDHRRNEDGVAWRPDVVVRLPDGKSLIVDSKVSLVNYEAAVSAEDEAERNRHLKLHIAAVRSHIDLLSAKGYQTLDAGSVDYVLMFMPIEGAFSEAWRQEGDLASYAIAKQIGIATPTTLMMTLRTVDHIWKVERRESNAQAIADRAGRLYDKLAGFVGNMADVGRHLDKAVQSHQAAVGQLSTGSGNVLGQADKLKRMGANASKSLAVPFDAEDDGDDPVVLAAAGE